MLLGLNWSLGVTNFAKDTISVVLHSLLVDIPIGAVQEQETVANETEIPSDAGTCSIRGAGRFTRVRVFNLKLIYYVKYNISLDKVMTWFVQLIDSEEYLVSRSQTPPLFDI